MLTPLKSISQGLSIIAYPVAKRQQTSRGHTSMHRRLQPAERLSVPLEKPVQPDYVFGRRGQRKRRRRTTSRRLQHVQLDCTDDRSEMQHKHTALVLVCIDGGDGAQIGVVSEREIARGGSRGG